MIERIFDKNETSGKKIIWIDAEQFEEEQEYISVLDRMITIAGEQFCPEDINWRSYHYKTGNPSKAEEYISEVSFTVKQKAYTIRLLCEGWFDEALITSVNTILDKEADFTERFYMVTTEDQSIIVVFIAEERMLRLKEDGLIDEEYSLPKPENFVSLSY